MGSESSPAGSIAPTPLTPNDARVHTVHARRVGAQRVFMLIDHLDLGGAQRHAGLVASHLAHSGHEVELAFTGQPDLRVDPSVRLISLAPRPVSRRADAAFEAASLTAAARFRPTIVHAHLFASAIAGYRVACRVGVPLVLSHHSTGTWRTDDDRRALAGPIAWAGHHFAASPEIRQQVIALGAAPDRVEFLANAVPVPEHPPARPPPSDTLRIGFLGRFSRDKDPVLVLQAMARLREQGVPARLEMRGGGELEPEVLAAVRSLALEEVVTLGEPVTALAEFFAGVDVLCLPSRNEGMPLVVLEAMGHGVPVVATRVGAVPLEVRDGVTGLLTEPGDAGRLAGCLAWLARHPAERQAMSTEARRRAAQAFSVERMGQRVEAVYARLVSKVGWSAPA